MQKRNWERRTLGKTGLEVTIMGIGGAWLGHSGYGEYDGETGAATVVRGLESGMNFIDTSGAYIGGKSEEFIGVALKEWFSRGNRREDLIICTKTGTRVRPHDYSYDFTMASVETSLKALGIDYFDILLVHDPESLDPVFAPQGALSALKRLKEDGTIGAIGLGCRSHEHHRKCIETGEFEVSLTFRDYNLIEQSALTEVIEPAIENGVGIINASIMVRGFLGGADPSGDLRTRSGPHGKTEEELIAKAQQLWEWCRERNVDLGTLNLQYCLRDSRIASTVLGFSRPARVEQNVKAFFEPISDDIWTELYRDFALDSTHR
ncbi:MAG: hypothetical protein CMN78_05895 [Spirochaetales bacterium]|nr:hypothetical protein [Spirochaetales bacterium]